MPSCRSRAGPDGRPGGSRSPGGPDGHPTAPAVICVPAGAIVILETTVSDDLPELIDWPPVTDLLADCPDWCTGRPHNHGSAYPGDQGHTSEPVELNIVTAEGRSELYALAELVWYPLSDTPEKRLIYVSMHWEDGSRCLAPPDLVAVADGLADYAEQLRELADRLTQLRGEQGGSDDRRGDDSSRENSKSR
jgi:hypothetical protein